MLFKEIVGQDEIKEQLLKSADAERIAHAQLFVAPEGSGALALAVAYAGFILCTTRSATDSCGACPSCLMVKKLGHPDLHFSFPITTKKETPDSDAFLSEFREQFIQNPWFSYNDWMLSLDAENKQGIIPVKESERILRKISLKSFSGGYKILIIWLPEKMNDKSANKLLKLLEEPPDQTVFLLVTEHEESLLRTVVSRTQLIKINRLPDLIVKEGLMKLKGISDAEAKSISYLAAGNFRDALFLSAHEITNGETPFSRFRNWMRMCYKGDILSIQKWVLDSSEYSRESMKGFFVYALHMIRESLMLNYGEEKLVRLSGEELEFLKKFSVYIHKGNCRKMIDELNEAAVQMEWNANIKILLTDLSLRFRDHLRIANPVQKEKV